MSQMNHKQFLERIAGSGGIFGGSGKSGGGESDDNTLRSKAILRFVELISEGPCEGLVLQGSGSDKARAERSIYFDETPIRGRNTRNIKGVEFSERKGTPDQDVIRGHANVESPFEVNTQVTKNNGPITRTINNEDADAVMVVMRIPALVEQNKKDGALKKTTVKYHIRVRPSGGTWQTVHEEEIKNEKTTGGYQLLHRVELPDNGNPWDIQVVRDTDDSDNDRLANETWWDTYIVRTEGKFIYPNSALLAFEVEARHIGGNMPQRFYRFRGIKCKVPSNYDPETRTYTGLWDGEWADNLKWTDNPAWIFLDLLTNDRYGLGEFVDESIVDKWSLYALAQHCDQKVKTGRKNAAGNDIMEPRYTFNGVIKSREEAWRVLQNVCASWRGLAFWSLGQVWTVADKAEDPVKLITPANVFDGRITYSGTALKARHSVALVTYSDPDNYFKPSVELVVNDAALQEFGWREKQVSVLGCASQSLAKRHGDWILDTEYYSTETANFAVSFQHADIKPGDIVAVADPRKANIRMGGRLRAGSQNAVTLDHPFEALPGVSYELMIALPDGSVETRTVASWSDEVIEDGESKGFRHAVFATPLSDDPLIHADWIAKGDVVPRQYRVLVMKETKANRFEVTALFHDPTKYARVERNKPLPDPRYTRFNTDMDPPENIQFRENVWVDRNGDVRVRASASWERPAETRAVRDYTVVIDHPDDGEKSYGPFAANFIEWEAVAGEYTVRVFANSYFDVQSEALEGSFVIEGLDSLPPPSIADLALREDPTTTVFDGRGIGIEWKNMFIHSNDPGSDDGADAIEDHSRLYDYTRVKVIHTASGDVLRNIKIKGTEFRYAFRDNKADNKKKGRPNAARGITFELTTFDKLDRASPTVTLAVTNPAPEAYGLPGKHGFTIKQRGATAELLLDEIEDADDIAGYLVWISIDSNFTPTGTKRGVGNCVYDGNSRNPVIDIKRGKVQYVVIAAYDSFGRTNLNRSGQVATVVGGTADSDNIPAMPTNLVASSKAEKDNQGHIRSIVAFDWDDNAESFFDHYELDVDEDGEDYNTYNRSKSRMQFRAQAKSVYRGRVRACDASGNKSAYTAHATVTAAHKSIKPAKPTGQQLKNQNRRVRLKIAKQTETDHKRSPVWKKSTNVLPLDTDPPYDYMAGTVFTDEIDPVEQAYYFVANEDASGNISDIVAFDDVGLSVPLTDADVDLPDFRQEVEDRVQLVTDQVSADITAMQIAYDAQLAAIQTELDNIDLGESGGELIGETIDRLRALTEEVRKASTHSMFQGAFSFTERKEIVATQNDDRAAFVEEIEVLVAADAALASRATTLEAETDDLYAGVETLETTMAAADQALATQITSLNATLEDKAEATAVQALETRVIETEDGITSLSSAITSLNSSLAGKASATALEALTTEVTEVDGNVSAVATALTELTAGTTPGNTATARMRMNASSAPSGWSARLGFQVRGGAGDTYQSAGLYMDVAPGQSRVVIEANKFMVVTSSGALAPFFVSGNTVTMTNVQMAAASITGQLTASQISVGTLSALSGTLGSVNISSAIMGSLQVGTLNIGVNAVSVTVSEDGAEFNAIAATVREVAGVTASWDNANTFQVFCQFKPDDSAGFNLYIYKDGSPVAGPIVCTPGAGNINYNSKLLSNGQITGTSGRISFGIERRDSGSTTIRQGNITVTISKR